MDYQIFLILWESFEIDERKGPSTETQKQAHPRSASTMKAQLIPQSNNSRVHDTLRIHNLITE